MATTLKKQVGETRTYSMDFSANMAAAETISTITSVVASPATGITLGTPSISGQKVLVQISAGTNNVRYKLVFTITTSAGQVLIADGELLVQNQ